MPDREKVIKGLEETEIMLTQAVDCGGEMAVMGAFKCLNRVTDALALLKEQKSLPQKMWNALYAEEDKLEERYVGTDEHDRWFNVYRPWLQRGFEIAIEVIAKQEEG